LFCANDTAVSINIAVLNNLEPSVTRILAFRFLDGGGVVQLLPFCQENERRVRWPPAIAWLLHRAAQLTAALSLPPHPLFSFFFLI
jgi:hypothetical protein